MTVSLSTTPMQILIIDDEANIRRTLRICLEMDGHSIVAVGTAFEAMEAVASQVFDMAFLDIRLGRENGLDLLPKLLIEAPWLNIVVITAYASIESAVEAMHRGAKDYLPKPFTSDQVRLTTSKAANWRRLEQRCNDLSKRLERLEEVPFLQTRNMGMKVLLETARKAAVAEATILLEGETGTGKTMLAQMIHSWSLRHPGPFGVISCPALASELLESELFGHAKGAFTGAVKDFPGRIALSDGGTLFLDEIGDLPLSLQPKLLRFLQDHSYERLGDSRTRRANVRVIAATNVNLPEAMKSGQFREDLYHRLMVISLRLPALRERPEDLLLLAQHFLTHFSRQHHRPNLCFSKDVETQLLDHSWPGNLRELRNTIERGAIFSTTTIIGSLDLPNKPCNQDLLGPEMPPELSGQKRTEGATLAEMEKNRIREVLNRSSSLQEAARILGIDPATLYRKRKNLNL